MSAGVPKKRRHSRRTDSPHHPVNIIGIRQGKTQIVYGTTSNKPLFSLLNISLSQLQNTYRNCNIVIPIINDLLLLASTFAHSAASLRCLALCLKIAGLVAPKCWTLTFSWSMVPLAEASCLVVHPVPWGAWFIPRDCLPCPIFFRPVGQSGQFRSGHFGPRPASWHHLPCYLDNHICEEPAGRSRRLANNERSGSSIVCNTKHIVSRIYDQYLTGVTPAQLFREDMFVNNPTPCCTCWLFARFAINSTDKRRLGTRSNYSMQSAAWVDGKAQFDLPFLAINCCNAALLSLVRRQVAIKNTGIHSEYIKVQQF